MQARQIFLISPYYENMRNYLLEDIELLKITKPQADTPEEAESVATMLIARNEFMAWILDYTAGQPIQQIEDSFEKVISAYENYQLALGRYENEPRMSPLGLDQLEDYEDCLQLIGIAVLLNRKDLLERITKIVDLGYAAEDTLYEELVGSVLPNRAEIDEWYHDKPYTTLIHAMYAETKYEASKLLNQYCKEWYPSFKHTTWHNSHLSMTSTEGAYFGYWAFEAGAVAYLYGIDDSQISHMVYPKDLVNYARNQKIAQ